MESTLPRKGHARPMSEAKLARLREVAAIISSEPTDTAKAIFEARDKEVFELLRQIYHAREGRVKETAEAAEISIAKVYRIFKKHGYTLLPRKGHARPMSEAKLARLREVAAIISSEPTDTAAAKRMGVTRERVRQLRNQASDTGAWDGQRPDPLGDKRRMAKELWDAGSTFQQISNEMGLPRTTIMNWLNRHYGIHDDGRGMKALGKTLQRFTDEQIRAAWEKTRTVSACARELGVYPSYVNRRLHKLGLWKIRDMGPKETAVIRAAEALATSSSYEEAAQKLGIKTASVRRYVEMKRIPKPDWDARTLNDARPMKRRGGANGSQTLCSQNRQAQGCD